jgi:hypothetical protein
MIIVRLKGGMGNQMFQYALGRALSLKYKTGLGLDLSFLLDTTPRLGFTFRNYDLDVFNIKADIVPSHKIPFVNRAFRGKIGQILDYLRRFIPNKGVEKSFKYDPDIFDIGEDAYLDGYWQSSKYFEDIEDVIREDFTLKDKLPLKIENLKEIIEKENSLCIHVRRGDYVGNKFHEVVGKDYYDKAIEKMKELTGIDKIYVFSDDIVWCEENMKFDLPVMFVGNEYAGEKAEGHLILMSSCKNFIIPNSTFAWWGAWLSKNKNKKVIVPEQWFGLKNVKFDIIPEGWIPLEIK